MNTTRNRNRLVTTLFEVRAERAVVRMMHAHRLTASASTYCRSTHG
jgi:hypothetical protein